MSKKGVLIIYDADLPEYEIIDVLPNENTAEIDIKLAEYIAESFPWTSCNSWKDALDEIKDILGDLF